MDIGSYKDSADLYSHPIWRSKSTIGTGKGMLAQLLTIVSGILLMCLGCLFACANRSP